MAEERALDIQRLAKVMDTTRQSIQDTLEELKDRVQESADWKLQVRRHPVASLWVAVACGLALAALVTPRAATALVERSGSAKRGRLGLGISLLGQLGALPALLARVTRLAGRLRSASRL